MKQKVKLKICILQYLCSVSRYETGSWSSELGGNKHFPTL